MSLLIKDDLSILFMHIPKCGGSSVVELFKQYNYSAQLEIRGLPPQRCLTASLQHQTPENLKLLIRQECLNDIFMVVRNPYARILSEFNWIFRDMQLNERPDLNKWILKSLKKASDNTSFADNHFRPSIDYIDGDMPSKIFKLEDGLHYVAEYYLRNINTYNEIRMPKEKDSRDFMDSLSKFCVSSEAISAINDFYSEDFEAFKYEMIDGKHATNSDTISQKNNDYEEKNRVKMAIKWRKETLKDLSSKLEEQMRCLEIELKNRDSSLMKLASEIEGAQAWINAPNDLLCDDIKARLNYLIQYTTNVDYFEQRDTSIEKINILWNTITEYRNQLAKKMH